MWCTTVSVCLILRAAKGNVISKSLTGNVTSCKCLNVSLQRACLCACMYHCLLLYCGVFPFSLCDLMQLAFIRSHLGAFDSKVPVSPLSNLRAAQAVHRRNPIVISILFLSETTSHKNTELLSFFFSLQLNS